MLLPTSGVEVTIVAPYDVAEHLTHPDDQAELIADAVASDDAAIIRDALNVAAARAGGA